MRSRPFTALAIATTRLERSRKRGLLSSRITSYIFLSNLVGLIFLAVASLILAEVRENVLEAKSEGLTTQAVLISNVLAETATVGEPDPTLTEWKARETLRRLIVPNDIRMRLYANDSSIVADTEVLADRVQQQTLRPPKGPSHFRERAEGFIARMFSGAIFPFTPDDTHQGEIAKAALGQSKPIQRFNEEGQRVISISVPIQHVAKVVGVLTVESADVTPIVMAERMAMVPFIILAALIALASSIWMAFRIAQPMRRLSGAADRLRLGFATTLEAPKELKREDEIGDLARAMQRMTRGLLDRIEANERFAADVAHEIKNPLTSIRSAVETVRSVKDQNARERLFAIIAADVGRLDRLVTDIARASRLEAETARGEAKRVDLTRMLPELVEIYSQTRREGEVDVVFKAPAPDGAIVMGQDGPLGQVFRNLIDNAKSFSPTEGDVTVSIEMEDRRDGPLVRIKVEDAGPGVPEANLETIFERFYTERPKGAAFGGNSGLGLSIARSIVEAHKGRIWAENMPGDTPGTLAGARFVVELPKAPSA